MKYPQVLELSVFMYIDQEEAEKLSKDLMKEVTKNPTITVTEPQKS